MLTKSIKNEIENTFAKRNIVVSTFQTGEQCEMMLKQKPAIAIVDYHLNSKYRDAMNGVKTIDRIRLLSPKTEIIMFTCEENATIAVKAMHRGAYDYIVKDDHIYRKLNLSIYNCLKLMEMKSEMTGERNRAYATALFITLFLGAIIAVEIFMPTLLR